jgi:hypothetical protein
VSVYLSTMALSCTVSVTQQEPIEAKEGRRRGRARKRTVFDTHASQQGSVSTEQSCLSLAGGISRSLAAVLCATSPVGESPRRSDATPPVCRVARTHPSRNRRRALLHTHPSPPPPRARAGPGAGQENRAEPSREAAGHRTPTALCGHTQRRATHSTEDNRRRNAQGRTETNFPPSPPLL